ncbi:MAG: NADH-quinone oxidoreductase subunit J [Amoebophilaceae bacterium]|jgi:NADH:ubiquinone oxidoreductase subunit 6 (subunit J)|nr:NADH-quinone oxidoreductase subunit J [Amoebophilaceae bacterium]
MTLIYVLLSGLLLVAALFVLLATQVFYAALGFLCVLLGMAALYFLQGASFVAVACVIVYGGGSLVLVLFSTFLLPLGTKPTQQRTKWIAVGSVLGLWGGGLWPLAHFAICTLQQQEPVIPLQANAITGLGLQLLGPYVLAFEWVGVSLLIALVGVAGVMGQQSSSRHVS